MVDFLKILISKRFHFIEQIAISLPICVLTLKIKVDDAIKHRHRVIAPSSSPYHHRIAPARTLSHNHYCHRTIAPLSSHLLLRHLSIDPNFDGAVVNYLAESAFHGDPLFLEWRTRDRVTYQKHKDADD